MTTLAQAKAALRPLGIVLAKKDGEYKVNFFKGREGTAYYTDDINDAVATGRHMAAGGYPSHGARRRTRQRHGNAGPALTWRGPAGGPYRGLVGSGPPHFTVERAGTKWRLLDANGDLMGTYSERDTAMRVARRVLAQYAAKYHGNAEISTGKFYAYKGHKVWVDQVPGGFFAMINGTAIQARGKTPGEALKRLRDRLDAGGPASANRKRGHGNAHRNAATEVRLALHAVRKDVARGISYPHALASAVKWYKLSPREVETLRAWYAGRRATSAYGNATRRISEPKYTNVQVRDMLNSSYYFMPQLRVAAKQRGFTGTSITPIGEVIAYLRRVTPSHGDRGTRRR